jgi:8-oxo-dGTP pyrophosphatase MutT (NUDIX family)
VVREQSAGGLVYRRRGTQCDVVLGGRRSGAHGPLTWGIPKGHVEPGETAPDAALREVRCETGLVAEIEEPLGDVEYRFSRRGADGQERVWKRVRFFLMRLAGGRFADRDAELDAVRWFPIAAAETTVTFANERALLRRARALVEA